jgi:O-antigen/teichoic acid export membrane protein
MKQPKRASKRVAFNTLILYAKVGITMFISLYTTRLILNSLGASDFGIFNIVGGAIAMLGFLNAAMAGATQRFMSYAEGAGDKEKQKSIFNISVILHLGIAILVGIVLLIAGYFFFHGILNIPADRVHAARMVYYFMIVSTMLTVMTVPYDAVLNAHENMLYYAIVGIIESVLKLAVAFVVVYTLSDKLIVYGLLMACISLLVMIIMRVYCKRNYAECEFRSRRYYDKGLMREMAGFAGWSLLGQASSIVSNYGIGIVMNMFFGTIVNATQGIANQVSGQLGVLGTSIKKSLSPVIAKSAGANNNELMTKSTIWGTKFFVNLL